LNTNDLKIGVVSLLLSIALYYFNKEWVADKKHRKELDNFDKWNITPRAWLLIIIFAAIGIVNILEFFYNPQ